MTSLCQGDRLLNGHSISSWYLCGLATCQCPSIVKEGHCVGDTKLLILKMPVFRQQDGGLVWWRCRSYAATQLHSYTATQLHRYTDTQIHRYTYTQLHTPYLTRPFATVRLHVSTAHFLIPTARVHCSQGARYMLSRVLTCPTDLPVEVVSPSCHSVHYSVDCFGVHCMYFL